MRANKGLGQHFLTDRNILNRIADAVDLAPGDVVLEIGPGKGDLTEILLARGARVVAIEKDRGLAHEFGVRNAERGIDQLRVVEGDALRADWHALLDIRVDIRVAIPHSAFPIPHFKLVGNIPYNITSPLLEKALTPPLPERIVFLVQEEVADRIVAAPGSKTYGALTVGIQAVAAAEKLFVVKAGSFAPPPRVRSAVLRLVPRAEPLVAPAEILPLRRFVTACFTKRRKQLVNAVPGATAAALTALGLDPMARPETLTPGEFVRLLRWSAQL